MVKLVSACLLGCEVTWRGGHNLRDELIRLAASGELIPICPEQLGGLPTPRPPAEIVGGDGHAVLDGRARVLTQLGQDVTENYLRGAREVLRLANTFRAELVILKERSPSCGVRWIYDGTFSSRIVAGCGVTTALLQRSGFSVISDEEFLAKLRSTP